MELTKQQQQPQYYPVVIQQSPQVYNQSPPVYNQQLLPIYNPQQQLQQVQQAPFQFPTVIKVELVNNVNAQREWTTSICDCCIKPGSCITGSVCPCILYGKNVENLSNGQKGCFCNALCCFLLPCSAFIRSPIRRQIRTRYNLQQEPCNDLCVSILCPCCALCQESRELENRDGETPRKQFMV